MSMRLSGLAIPYNKPCLLSDGTAEQIAPGAMSAILSRGDKVMLCIEHSPPLAMASTRDGTLRLSDRPDGLYFTADLADTSYVRDLVALIQANRRSFGCSFHMRLTNSGLTHSTLPGGRQLRTVKQFASLPEITVTWGPYYESTWVAVEQDDTPANPAATAPDGYLQSLLTHLKIRERATM